MRLTLAGSLRACVMAGALAGGGGCAEIVGADFSPKRVEEAPACEVNEDCAGGEPAICRKDTHECVTLTTEDCTLVYGDYEDDGALLLGSILPTTGIDATAGLPMQNAILLGIKDFTSVAGLPPSSEGGPRRPLALVGCTDESDNARAVGAAAHLIDDVGVPAIIGGAFSGVAIDIATKQTIPKGVLLFSPSATSVNITALDDHGLVWRTSPPDTFQGRAMAFYVARIEQKVRQELGLSPDEQVRVAAVHKGDAYGKDLVGVLEQELVLNGAPALSNQNKDAYLHLNYGNPDDVMADPTKYKETVESVVAFAPHITVIVGTAEGLTEIFQKVEEGWPAAAEHRSQFVFSDGGLLPELSEYVGANDDLRKRTGGTVPGTDSPLFHSFRSAFLSEFPSSDPNGFGVAGSYDIVYLLSYSVAANGNTPLTATSLTQGFTRLVPPGTPLDVGHLSISAAFSELSKGQSVDFNGASGPLDFDLDTGEASSDIQIWCLPKNAMTGKAGNGVTSGLYYDAKTQMMGGEIGSECD